jgi:CxxC-x17-CxxC domain-containing protein
MPGFRKDKITGRYNVKGSNRGKFKDEEPSFERFQKGNGRSGFNKDRQDRPQNKRANLDKSRPGYQDYFDVKCSKCGKDCKIPFKPVSNKPVFCEECFRKNKETRFEEPNEESNIESQKEYTKELQKINEKLNKIMKVLNVN